MSLTQAIKIIVTGSKGQLGSEIRALAPKFPDFHFTYIDMDEVDLADESSIRKYFSDKNFTVIIHCAAYTAVDLAEDNQDISFKVNRDAVKTLAEIARDQKMRFIHISTDYVFNGEGNQPIHEQAEPEPLSVYGHSKLEGEKVLQAILPDSYILRTAWVYSSFGKNFVKTIRQLASQRPELNVVADQIGTPTYARDLAHAILSIIDSIFTKGKDKPGIYHFSNEGVISWYDLACFIVRHEKLACTINPIRTEEYKTKAVRPKFSVLDKKKIKDTFGITPPYWYDSLVSCLKEME